MRLENTLLIIDNFNKILYQYTTVATNAVLRPNQCCLCARETLVSTSLATAAVAMTTLDTMAINAMWWGLTAEGTPQLVLGCHRLTSPTTGVHFPALRLALFFEPNAFIINCSAHTHTQMYTRARLFCTNRNNYTGVYIHIIYLYIL